MRWQWLVVTFAEEMLNGKIHFLCSVTSLFGFTNQLKFSIIIQLLYGFDIHVST